MNATLKVVNRYNFVNLDGFVFQWEISKESKVVSSGRERYRVSPRSTFYFPLAFSVPQAADHLAFSILDPEGYCIVDQEFPLPSELTSSSTDEILKKVGLQTTGPISLSPASGKRIMNEYQAICVANHQLCVNDHGGKELFTLNGFAMQPEKSSWTTMQVEPIQYLPAQGKTHSLSIPFTVKGNLIDKSKEWLISGTIRVEFGQSWIRFTYSFSSDRECVFPEAGLRLKLSSLLTQLSWNRDALNLATPKEWADNTLEQHISLKVLQAVISKRRLHWLSLEGENHMLLLIPFGPMTNIRIGDSLDEVVISDFLSAGNFLGKADKETAEKKLAVHEEFRGGFIIYFLNREQRIRFSQLSAPEKDLTWSPRVKGYFTLTDGQYGGDGG